MRRKDIDVLLNYVFERFAFQTNNLELIFNKCIFKTFQLLILRILFGVEFNARVVVLLTFFKSFMICFTLTKK